VNIKYPVTVERAAKRRLHALGILHHTNPSRRGRIRTHHHRGVRRFVVLAGEMRILQSGAIISAEERFHATSAIEKIMPVKRRFILNHVSPGSISRDDNRFASGNGNSFRGE